LSDRGGRSGHDRWASDHERARQRAAERLSLPLPAAENHWLNRHLASCPSCAAVATDYAAQQAALRGLPEAIPPRDLWARTSAALDQAERQARREVPNPSVFPGRGGMPGSRGSRSIRGLRAERRASAFRSTPRSVPPRLLLDRPVPGRATGLAWLAPFGALAAMALVIVVGGTALLTNSIGPGLTPVRSPGASQAALLASGPAATPIAVGAGDVAWITPSEGGTYSLTFGQVDEVCPTTAAPDCAPIPSAAARQLPAVNAKPHTVIQSPSKQQLVVVTSSSKGRGASLLVVAVPTPVPPADTTPSAAATQSPTPAPTAWAEPTTSAAAATASVKPSPSATDAASPVPSETSPGATDAAATASATDAAASPTGSAGASLEPTGRGGAASTSPAATAAGSAAETTAPSESAAPTGTASASESAQPAAAATPSATAPATETPSASASPQPTATALAIISDVVIVGETAAYSPDGTMLAFTARPADNSHGPDIYLWRVGESSAHPLTDDHASIFSGWFGGRILGSRAVDAAGSPATGQSSGSVGATGAGGAAASAAASGADGANASSGAAAPSDGSSAAPTASDSTGATTANALARGGAGVMLLATAQSNAEGAATLSFAGRAGAAVAPAAPAAAASASADPASPAASDPASTAEQPAGTAVARSFILDPASDAETPLTAPAWRPVVDPTGRFVIYWAGTLRYDASTLTWLPDQGVLVLASWPSLSGSDPKADLAPVPLLNESVDGSPSGEWDIRWDESGTHVGVWLADPGDPNVGRLSLLTIDASTGRVDADGISLHGVPALPGFSIGGDRLAWATPPGQDGEGSRVQVLAWSGANAGKIDSQPASGNDAVIVVR
jgi:hypothetical protein